MSRKKRYIESLTKKQIAALKQGMKNGKSHAYRQRCHAILLSFNRHSVSELQSIFSTSKQTIYSWFDRYESGGIQGLQTKPGQGRKAVLSVDNKEHVKAVEKAVNRVNKKGGNLLAEVDKELNLEQGVTMRMLRFFLKKLVSSGNDAEEY